MMSLGKPIKKVWGVLLLMVLVVVSTTTYLSGNPNGATDPFSSLVTSNYSIQHSTYATKAIHASPNNVAPEVPLPPIAFAALWNQTYGGSNIDHGNSVVECSGGGFAIAGSTRSFGAGTENIWLIRTDANGNHLWNQTYGGALSEFGSSVVECGGGGFIIVGATTSFGANPGNSWDIWLVRTDASGNHLWNQTFGGIVNEWGRSVMECSGGGFIIGGHTNSFGAGSYDFWVVRTDASGNHLWNQTFGGSTHDYGYTIVECSGGDFAIVGDTESFGAGLSDAWLVRMDQNGAHLWNQTYGGTNNDNGWSLVECSGGGFAITGRTNSFSARNSDVWLIRTDTDGTLFWQNKYGGKSDDMGMSVIELGGDNFTIVGYTNSFGAGSNDFWLVCTNQLGEYLGDRTYGGTNNEYGRSLVEVSGGGLVITGSTESFGNGSSDAWLFRETEPPLQDSTPPFWDETPINQIVEFGQDFFYDVNASDLSAISYYWINDTTNFIVDPGAYTAEGVILNVTFISVGSYGLETRAYDAYDNYCSAIIKVTVQDTTSPEFVTPPSDIILAYGQLLDTQLEATDLSGIQEWTINDTTHFTLSNTGHLTSNTSLDPGNYGLKVTVYDPYDNSQSTSFTITVLPPAIPGYPLEAILIGLVITFISAIFVRRRRIN